MEFGNNKLIKKKKKEKANEQYTELYPFRVGYSLNELLEFRD